MVSDQLHDFKGLVPVEKSRSPPVEFIETVLGFCFSAYVKLVFLINPF